MGRVEWQPCNQLSTGVMGDVCVVCVCVWGGGGRMAVMQSTLRWEDGRSVCVCVGGGGRTAVMQSTLRWEDGRCVCVWGGGGEQCNQKHKSYKLIR